MSAICGLFMLWQEIAQICFLCRTAIRMCRATEIWYQREAESADFHSAAFVQTPVLPLWTQGKDFLASDRRHLLGASGHLDIHFCKSTMQHYFCVGQGSKALLLSLFEFHTS